MRQRYAIIDVGSNAIRASVYDGDTIGCAEIYNDKFKSDLEGLLSQSELNIKHHTYLTFQHFIHIFKKLNVVTIKCIATAVLRDHPRALEFTQIIKDKFNLNIEILTGIEEAYYGAMGVALAIYNARGIVADFGGGSLEIAVINKKEVYSPISLPLGSKILQQNSHISEQDIIGEINNKFSVTQENNMYFIGGALRLVGRLYMSHIKYPISNLHNYEIPTFALIKFLNKISTEEDLLAISNGYNLNNVDNIPAAIKVIKALIHCFNPEKIIISNYGLKEGVRYLNLVNEEKSKDIVIERCKDFFYSSQNLFEDKPYQQLVYDLLPVNSSSGDFNSLTKLALTIANNINIVDKVFKATYISELILATDIPFTHRQRIVLALIMSYAYRSKSDLKIHKLSKQLISFEDLYISQIIGNVIRICRCIDGPQFSTPSFSFVVKNDYIEIKSSSILPKPIFNKVCTHLKDIGFARKKINFKH